MVYNNNNYGKVQVYLSFYLFWRTELEETILPLTLAMLMSEGW